jgi:hypothetical protein
MARPIYTHEMFDPDYSWLITRFKENNPTYVLVDIAGSPLVLLQDERPEQAGAVSGVPVQTGGTDEEKREGRED